MKKIKLRNIILLILITFALISFTYSKYVNKKNNETVYEATDFYFESEVLSDSNIIKEYNYAEGINSITVDIKNYIDELRYSEVPINYEVSITDTNGNTVSDSNGTQIAKQTGTLVKSSKKSATVTFNNLQTGTYIVSARATAPYSKTIKAKYIIRQNIDGIDYSVSDSEGSNIALLTVSTKNYSGNINISWPEGLIPDSTDSKFLNVNSQSSAGNISINFDANSEYTFKFFKNTPSNKYTKNQFTVTK